MATPPSILNYPTAVAAAEIIIPLNNINHYVDKNSRDELYSTVATLELTAFGLFFTLSITPILFTTILTISAQILTNIPHFLDCDSFFVFISFLELLMCTLFT
jgi:hypothetical protein